MIDSSSYRHLSLWARAVLVEIVRKFNGYNNGQIGCSQRELADALNTTNFRKIGAAIAELMAHGMIDVSTEGKWKERQAREYRLTFVSTGAANHFRPATNDYQRWEPVPSGESGADASSAGKAQSADDASAEPRRAADSVSAKIALHRRKNVPGAPIAADDASSLIVKPYPPTETDQKFGPETAFSRRNSEMADFALGAIHRRNVASRKVA